MSAPITLYCDGLCEPRNPGGWACWGWVAVDDDGQVLAHGHGCLPGAAPEHTNNVAEYHAVLAALRWAYRQNYKHLVVCSDSQLVIHQADGRWACNAPGLQGLLARVRQAEALLNITWAWVPRERNETADHYSRVAYREATGRRPPVRTRTKGGAK